MPAKRALPTTTYAVLGLLGLGSRSGYDLVSIAEQSIAYFWPINKSQIYGELARLEELGYVKATSVQQERLPDKRVFEQTSAGRKAMAEWLDSPDYEADRFRSGLMVKVFFAESMDRDTFKELITNYRRQVEEGVSELKTISDSLTDPSMFFIRATALLGLRSHEAALEWADEILKKMPKGNKQKERTTK